MAKRAFSSLVLWTIVLSTLWFCHTTGAIVIVALIAALTLLEFYRLLAAAGDTPFIGLGTFFGVLIAISPWVCATFGPVGDPAWLQAQFDRPTDPLLALAAVIFSIRILGERPAEKRVSALASTLFGLVYVGVLMQYLVRIITPLPGDAISANGRLVLCLWLVAVAKFSDVGGLLAGMAVGRHPLAPQVSPKKTWEGAVGGVLMAMLVGAIVAGLAHSRVSPDFTPLRAALTAIPIAVLAIVSDLVESVIKRRAESKDSGSVIPGIGGIFDMSDSLILAAPVGYFLGHSLLGLR